MAITFGKTTPGATDNGAIAANAARASKFPLNDGLQPTSFFLRCSSSGALSFKVAVYRDDGASGIPGTRLWTGELVLPGATANGWQEISMAGAPLLAPGNYWLAYVPNGAGGTTSYTTAGQNSQTKTITYATGFPASWGAQEGTVSREYAMYVQGDPAGGLAHILGSVPPNFWRR